MMSAKVISSYKTKKFKAQALSGHFVVPNKLYLCQDLRILCDVTK